MFEFDRFLLEYWIIGEWVRALDCTVCQDVGLTKGPDVRGLSPMSLFYYWRAVRSRIALGLLCDCGLPRDWLNCVMILLHLFSALAGCLACLRMIGLCSITMNTLWFRQDCRM